MPINSKMAKQRRGYRKECATMACNTVNTVTAGCEVSPTGTPVAGVELRGWMMFRG